MNGNIFQRGATSRWILWAIGLVALLAMAIAVWLMRSPERETGSEHVKFRLQWFPQAQFAGYLVAKDLGYYAGEGLNVEILPAGPDLKPQITIASGADDIAVGVSNQVIAARSNGVPLKIVAQIFQDSANRYVLKKKNAITSLEQLRGKKIGLWTGGDEAEFISMLKTVGMNLKDVVVVPQGFTVTPFMQDEYVLSEVTVYNELIQLRELGLTDDKLQELSSADYGSAIVSDMLFTSEKYLQSHKEIISRFLVASMRGWQYCVEHPEQAIDIVMKANPSLSKDQQVKQLKEVLALVLKEPAKTKGIGYMDADAYRTAERVLFESGQIVNRVDPQSVFDESLWRAIPDKFKLINTVTTTN